MRFPKHLGNNIAFKNLVTFYVLNLHEIQVSIICGNCFGPIIDVYIGISAYLSIIYQNISQILRDFRSGSDILLWTGVNFLHMFKRSHFMICGFLYTSMPYTTERRHTMTHSVICDSLDQNIVFSKKQTSHCYRNRSCKMLLIDQCEE